MDKRILIVVTLVGLAILACGQEPTPPPTYTPYPTYTPIPTSTPKPSLGPVTFSSDFDEEAEKPVNVGTSFDYGITTLYAYWPYGRVEEGTPFRWDFYHEDSHFYGEYGVFDDTSGYAWQWIYGTSGEALKPGTYELVVKVGEEVVLRDGCVVKEAKAAFGPIVFAEGVTEDDQPINPTSSFPAGTWKVYAIFDYRGMRDGMEWKRKWYFEGEEDLSKTEVWDAGESGAFWLRFYDEAGLASGNYELELYVEGQLLQSGTFVIEKSAPTPTPTPTKVPSTPTPTQVPPTPPPTQPPATTATLRVTNWTGMRVGFFINATQYFIEPNSTLTLELPPGRYPYTISRTGYSPARGVAELEAGRIYDLSITAEVG